MIMNPLDIYMLNQFIFGCINILLAIDFSSFSGCYLDSWQGYHPIVLIYTLIKRYLPQLCICLSFILIELIKFSQGFNIGVYGRLLIDLSFDFNIKFCTTLLVWVLALSYTKKLCYYDLQGPLFSLKVFWYKTLIQKKWLLILHPSIHKLIYLNFLRRRT